MNNDNKNTDPRKQIDIPSFVNRGERNSDDFIRNVNSTLKEQVDSYLDDDLPEEDEYPPRKKRVPKAIKAILLIISVLTVLCCLLIFTDGGKRIIFKIAGNYIYGNFKYQPSDKEASGDSQLNSGVKVGELGPVINILLIGVEEFEGARNTDSMIVATMNTKDHTLKLTSLMRDLYVDIPGYDRNRLNSAYAKGKISLLYQTIEDNFDLKLDGYCMVNFDAFEKIVDLVGGVEITLTSQEAHYLNTTNYISEKANRKVVEGTQLMNGNQALGYCRVRKVPTATEHDDFGRTQRQRIVLDAIYDRLRSKNAVELVLLMNKILSQVDIETDISNTVFNQYLEEAVSLKLKELKMLRVPADGSYDNASVPIGSRNQEVLVPKDWDALRKDIHSFIYGEEASDIEPAN